MRNNLTLITHHQDDGGPEDDIFFRKHQLRVGTALRFHGRSANRKGELWFVTGIFTTRNGKHVPRSEVFPQTLDDLVRLKNHQTQQVRFASFIYLSYSAVWRIDE